MKLYNYLIAVDLDGTLITEFDNYDQESFQVLKDLAKENYVIIATGRPLRSSKFYYDLLELNTPIINYNGALLHHPKNHHFPTKTLHIPKELLFKFINDNDKYLETVFCEIGDDIYLHQDHEYVHPYLHSDGGNLTIGHLDITLPGDPNGAIVFSRMGSEQQIVEYVNNEFAGKVNIRVWHVKEMVVAELYNPLTSKANALKEVARFYNISDDKIIAFGDGHNDLEMIQNAYIGVAMANSHPDLLKIAKYQTKSVLEHGVAYFLNNTIKEI